MGGGGGGGGLKLAICPLKSFLALFRVVFCMHPYQGITFNTAMAYLLSLKGVYTAAISPSSWKFFNYINTRNMVKADIGLPLPVPH